MTSIFRRHSRGRPPHPDVLTPAEWRVLEEIREGRSNPEIAERLGLSRNTVKTHISSMLSKLDVRDREELAAWRGEPAVTSARRSWLLAPFGWVTTKVAGGVAVTGVLAVVLVGFLAAMESGRVTGGADPTPPVTSATETPEEARVDSGPSFAPDGRTGDPTLDDLIESLVHHDAATLAQQFAGSRARSWLPETDGERVYATSEWAERLANADRSLYAVLEGDEASPTREFEIVLAVSEAGAESVGWSFAIQGQNFVDISVGSTPPASYASAVERQYDRYLVLPPQDMLPTPPAGHGLDVRSGHAGVDALLAFVEAGDAASLAANVDYARRTCDSNSPQACPSGIDSGETDALQLRSCGKSDAWISPQDAERRLERIASITSAIHGVAQVPEGYQPQADHLLMLVTQVAPYRWESAGIFERDGQIVGLYTQCYEHPQGMYPPSAFVLAPPADPTSLNPERTSGIAEIDESLAAVRSGDVSALDRLADWGQVGCVTVQNGVDAPPLCEPGEPPGSLIDALSVVSCEGGPRRRADVGQMFGRLASEDWALYAVSDIGPPGADWMFPPGGIEAVMVHTTSTEAASDAPLSTFALSFTEDGFASVQVPCAPTSPESLMSPGRAPSFLLAPP